MNRPNGVESGPSAAISGISQASVVDISPSAKAKPSRVSSSLARALSPSSPNEDQTVTSTSPAASGSHTVSASNSSRSGSSSRWIETATMVTYTARAAKSHRREIAAGRIKIQPQPPITAKAPTFCLKANAIPAATPASSGHTQRLHDAGTRSPAARSSWYARNSSISSVASSAGQAGCVPTDRSIATNTSGGIAANCHPATRRPRRNMSTLHATRTKIISQRVGTRLTPNRLKTAAFRYSSPGV